MSAKQPDEKPSTYFGSSTVFRFIEWEAQRIWTREWYKYFILFTRAIVIYTPIWRKGNWNIGGNSRKAMLRIGNISRLIHNTDLVMKIFAGRLTILKAMCCCVHEFLPPNRITNTWTRNPHQTQREVNMKYAVSTCCLLFYQLLLRLCYLDCNSAVLSISLRNSTRTSPPFVEHSNCRILQ